MIYALLRFAHILGAILIGGGLISVWFSDLRSRQLHELPQFAEAVRNIAVYYDGVVVPGALLLLVSGTWTIILYADRTRALPVNDPDDRELTISCGCALFNLRIAAANAGFASAVWLLPDESNPDFLASVSFRRAGDSSRSEAELFPGIERRRIYRRRFDTRQVPDDVLRELSEYLNQPIQVASLRPKLRHLLGTSGFPQILLRLGFPVDDLPAAPRRSLKEVVG